MRWESKQREKCVAAGLLVIERLKAGLCDLAEMRRATRRGECVLCGETAFSNIALHVARLHGIGTREFRDMLLFTFRESICSPEFSQKQAQNHEGDNPSRYPRKGHRQKVSIQGARIRQEALRKANRKRWYPNEEPGEPETQSR
jgi:hypothetical protein